MKIGKLPPALLDKYIFSKIAERPPARGEVLMGAEFGEDCAALSLEGELCVLSADPITAGTVDMGSLAVHVNVNDIAACGCEPVGIMLTVLLPEDATEETLADIMNDVFQTADALGVSVIGGHTEVTDAVTRPVVSAAIVGKTRSRRFIRSGGGAPGQDLVMTKWAALEGTAILAKSMAEPLAKQFGQPFVDEARKAGRQISVLTEARVAAAFGASAMHDATEGGILGACYEMAEASRVGVDIFIDDIPVQDVTRRMCSFLRIDPLKLISSGSMLIMTVDGAGLVSRLRNEGVHAAIIGHVTNGGRHCISKNSTFPLPLPDSDELYRAFSH